MVSFYIYRGSVVNSCQDRLQTRTKLMKSRWLIIVNVMLCHVACTQGREALCWSWKGWSSRCPSHPPVGDVQIQMALFVTAVSLCLSRACLGKLSLCIGVSTALKTQNGEHAK